jgi:SnoaL-like protein
VATLEAPPVTVGRQFVEAFNRRDVDALTALVHERCEFHPSGLVGSRQKYVGTDGVRRWIDDLATAGMKHQALVHEVRPLDSERFVVISEVLLDGESVTPSAMVGRVIEGKLVEARSYLSDESTLREMGVIP